MTFDEFWDSLSPDELFQCYQRAYEEELKTENPNVQGAAFMASVRLLRVVLGKYHDTFFGNLPD